MLYFSTIYILFVIFFNIFQESDIKITSIILNNMLNLLSIFWPLVPFLWLFLIQKKTVKLIMLLFYGIFFVFVTPIIWFGSYMVHGDLDNGWRLVYKERIDHESFIGVYRTPDLGALGGDNLALARVTPIFPGLERRSVISLDVIKDYHARYDLPIEITFEGVHITIPSPDDLYNRSSNSAFGYKNK